MKVNELMKQRRLEIGLTLKEVADRVGVNEGTVSRWESGEITNMRRDKIAILSRVLSIPVEVLLGRSEETESVSARRIPVFGRVAAGIPMEAIEDIVDYEDIPDSWQGEYMALRIKGDSMMPLINDGDVVIARKQSDADSGDIVIAQINGQDATIKKLIKQEHGITLQPFNAMYEPLYFSSEQQKTAPVRIIAKVVENRHKF